jgi:hypothetical protein
MASIPNLDDPTWYPKAPDGLETNEVTDGYIVYQPERDRVHYLNHTAAILLALCNGKSSVTDLPELLREAFGLPVPPAAEVRACLQQLVTEGLIA